MLFFRNDAENLAGKPIPDLFLFVVYSLVSVSSGSPKFGIK